MREALSAFCLGALAQATDSAFDNLRRLRSFTVKALSATFGTLNRVPIQLASFFDSLS
jgi:hypothetical protein